MPNADGQYLSTSQLASPRYARFTSYLTDWIAWAGSLFTCASIALGVGDLCMAAIQTAHQGIDADMRTTHDPRYPTREPIRVYGFHEPLSPR